MNYSDAIRYVYALERRGIKLDMRRLRAALHLVGDPHKKLRFVHVAGTNGKGSVSAFLESSLRAGGYRTGLFTSPHLHRWVERIQIDGKPLGKGKAAKHLSRVREVFDGVHTPELSFFETTLLTAFIAFVDAKVDVVVLEVGLGGRLDATNVVTPIATVITRVAKDHMEYLGDSLPSIAREKAGILKRRVPLVCGVRPAGLRRVIAARAKELDAKALWIDEDFGATKRTAAMAEQVAPDLWTRGRGLAEVSLGLRGAHQGDNAAIALATLDVLATKGLRCDDEAIRRGMARVSWPARLERLPGKPPLLLDAAHNPDGCRALAAFLAASPVAGKRVLLFGAMEDKEYGQMLPLLAPHVDAIVYTAPKTSRAATPKDLARIALGQVIPSSAAALQAARRKAGPSGEVVVAGSIFLVAEVRATILGLASDPLIRM